MDWRWTVVIAALAAACSTPGAPRDGSEDLGPDGLYADFFDGKFDAYGHPLGAEVVAVPDDCTSSAGDPADGWLWPDRAGELSCTATVAVGTGPYAVNLRVNAPAECAGIACGETALTVRVRLDDDVVAEREVTASALSGGESNVPLRWTSRRAGALEIEVEHIDGALGLAYIEVFRTSQTVRIEPASGPDLTAGELIRIDYRGHSPESVELELSCNGEPLGDALQTLIDDGLARREVGDFRALVEAPAELLGGCDPPRSLLVRARRSFGQVAAARATYGYQPPECDFAPGTTRVLLTGFEPFPADASGDNSSREAVLAFDPQSVPGVSSMAMILPVEWHVGYQLMADVIDRCQPDVVLSFGQGRNDVDVETIGYNQMNTSAVPGGIPDNRGVIESGTPIAAEGPDEVTTGLPAGVLVAALAAKGHDVESSTDPGRYICNNLFYELMRNHGSDTLAAGFIHLPRDPHIDADERAELGSLVTTVVKTTLGQL